MYIELYNYPEAKEIFTRTSEYFLEHCGKNTDYFCSRGSYIYVCALSGEGSWIIEEADKLLELNGTFTEPCEADELIEAKATVNENLGNYEESIK